MKYKRLLLLVLALFLAVLAGCRNKGQEIEKPQPPTAETESKLIEAVESSSLDTGIMTKLREFSVDLDLDGTEENIELYTAAGRGENGEMMWDDGQNWLLSVCDGDKSYPLLSRFIQLGVVHFTVSNDSEEELPYITVIIPTDSSFAMWGYSYDKEKDGFSEELLYKSEDDFWMYSTIQGY